jgi:calcineurin-like phosphoesterase family protein
MTTTWLTSDWHVGHAGILRRQPGRACWGTTAEEAAQAFLTSWNGTVSKRDIVWALGDLFWGERWFWEIGTQMNGRIHAVLGNHDENLSAAARATFERVEDYAEIRLGLGVGRTVLCHYPFRTWRNSWHGAVHCHGHSHNTEPVRPDGDLPEEFWRRRVDVGIDAWGLRPASVDEVRAVVEGRT